MASIHTPLPSDEQERQRALDAFRVLDTAREPAFDRVTAQAARLLEAPAAFLTLIDRDRLWFKSVHGSTVAELPREHAFCAHCILQRDVMVVPDTLLDERFAANAYVVDKPHIRFYAGSPLLTPEGFQIGVLCVTDLQPRAGLTVAQQAALTTLAAVAVDLLSLHRQSVPLPGGSIEKQRALEQSEARFRTLVHSSSDIVTVMGVGGELLFQSTSVEQVLGYKPSEMLGTNALSYVHPDDLAMLAGELCEALQGKPRGDPMLYRFRTVAGGWVWLESIGHNLLDDPNVQGLLIHSRDVTERREAEEKLRRSEAGFRSLIEHSPDGVAVTSRGRCVYANPTLARAVGFRQEELNGRLIIELLHPDDREKVVPRLRALQEGQTLDDSIEVRALHRDGHAVHFEVLSLPITFDGEPALVSILRDLTERKLVQQRLLFADRMASMGTLAAGVAHEINNPLAYVMANLAIVNEEIAGLAADLPLGRTTELAQAIREAREGAERVRNIVRDLRTLSRPDAEVRGPVDVRRVVESSINLTWNEIRHRARLVKDLGPVPPVEANESRLGQVFINLLVNASQAIPVGNAGDNQIHVVTSTDASGRAVIEVRDSGVGMSPEVRTHLFDPFFTTKPVGEGTGLGLAICRGIVTAIGGEILVDSEVGRGSSFRVVLPGCPASVAVVPAATRTPPGRRGRVLVVDDEPMICTSLNRLLAREHEITTVTRAQEALELIADGESFDVILCDLMMPEMTGMDLHRFLDQIAPLHAVRMVFLTGGAFTPAAREFLDRVSNQRVDKPFDAQNLRNLVRVIVGQGEGAP